MNDIGLWVGVSLPLFVASTNRLKGQSQDIALWIYFWGMGAVWAVKLWQLYQAYLSVQQMDMEPYGMGHQSEIIHVLWVSAVAMAIMMAVPPILYVRNRRKANQQRDG